MAAEKSLLTKAESPYDKFGLLRTQTFYTNVGCLARRVSHRREEMV
jgi:hypothetical protein